MCVVHLALAGEECRSGEVCRLVVVAAVGHEILADLPDAMLDVIAACTRASLRSNSSMTTGGTSSFTSR